jgi:cardiolipin synthase
VGDLPAQMFSSSITGGGESMHLMYLMAITAARHTIHLSNSYFVPDDLAVKALIAAAKRGVDVRIITPGKIIDSDIVRAASRDRWGKLLAAGVKMAEYQPTMYHVKALVVDSLLVSVGSTNFDNRSFTLNDEANLNVLDADFARQQETVFENDWRRALPVSLRQWEDRPLFDKAAGKLADLVSPQL